jgi:alpha,alpha-trehalase
MNRRAFVEMAVMGAAATALRANASVPAIPSDSGADGDLLARWHKMDDAMRGWWDADLQCADEAAIRQGSDSNAPIPPGSTHRWPSPATLLFLPFPYSSGGGAVGTFPEMYGWDIHFVNLGLIAHGRTDIVRWNILDQLFMIERFGKMLDSNRIYDLDGGQPPLLAMSVDKYLSIEKDDEEVAMMAYPLLQKSYRGYWNAPGHSTPIGLSTCRNSGKEDPRQLELLSEGEAGLDYTPIFGGQIQNCVPIHVNCALMRQAQVLGSLAERFGWSDKASQWRKEAEDRAKLINEYCWDPKEGFYFEYDYVRKTRLPYYSLNAYWPLWTNIATPSQAKGVVDHLGMFDHTYGLTFTDRAYPEVHSEHKALEWEYPESWPQQQIVAGEALVRYGYEEKARRISRRYMANVIATWERTGLTWERYNGVGGGHTVPVERDPPQPLHGFSSAAAVVVGRIAFG